MLGHQDQNGVHLLLQFPRQPQLAPQPLFLRQFHHPLRLVLVFHLLLQSVRLYLHPLQLAQVFPQVLVLAQVLRFPRL